MDKNIYILQYIFLVCHTISETSLCVPPDGKGCKSLGCINSFEVESGIKLPSVELEGF